MCAMSLEYHENPGLPSEKAPASFKVLLVDDEYLELELLKNNVDWNAYGFSVCATAKNGREALEQVHLYAPHVVITDIKMPVMDGVALSHALHREYPNIILVFLSGYNQFEYLKSALRVNAADYLMKPLDFSEMATLLCRLAEKCAAMETTAAQRDAMLNLYLRRTVLEEDGNAQGLLRCQLGAKAGQTFYCALLTIDEYAYLTECGEVGMGQIQQILDTVRRIGNIEGVVLTQLEPDRFFAICKTPFSAVSMEGLNRDISKWQTVCFGREPVDIGKFRDMYSQLKKACKESSALQGSGQIIFYPLEAPILGELPHEEVCPEYNILLQHIQSGDCPRALAWLAAYYGYASREHPLELNAKYTVQLLDLLYSSFWCQVGVPHIVSKDLVMKKALQIRSPVTLTAFVGNLLIQLIQSAAVDSCDPTQAVIPCVLEYIDENYAQPLTVASLAQKFNFSTNYFSAIFKKATGKTVLEHITDIRLQKSVYYLQETNLRVSQITQAVGYSNSSYYCRLFSDKYGVTPNQFRSRVRK